MGHFPFCVYLYQRAFTSQRGFVKTIFDHCFLLLASKLKLDSHKK